MSGLIRSVWRRCSAPCEPGSFCVSTGVTVSSLTLEGDHICVGTENAARIRFIGHGGSTLLEVEDLSARYRIVGNEGYVRIECENDRSRWAGRAAGAESVGVLPAAVDPQRNPGDSGGTTAMKMHILLITIDSLRADHLNCLPGDGDPHPEPGCVRGFGSSFSAAPVLPGYDPALAHQSAQRLRAVGARRQLEWGADPTPPGHPGRDRDGAGIRHHRDHQLGRFPAPGCARLRGSPQRRRRRSRGGTGGPNHSKGGGLVGQSRCESAAIPMGTLHRPPHAGQLPRPVPADLRGRGGVCRYPHRPVHRPAGTSGWVPTTPSLQSPPITAST